MQNGVEFAILSIKLTELQNKSFLSNVAIKIMLATNGQRIQNISNKWHAWSWLLSIIIPGSIHMH